MLPLLSDLWPALIFTSPTSFDPCHTHHSRAWGLFLEVATVVPYLPNVRRRGKTVWRQGPSLGSDYQHVFRLALNNAAKRHAGNDDLDWILAAPEWEGQGGSIREGRLRTCSLKCPLASVVRFQRTVGFGGQSIRLVWNQSLAQRAKVPTWYRCRAQSRDMGTRLHLGFAFLGFGAFMMVPEGLYVRLVSV